MTQRNASNAAEFPDNPHFPPSREEDQKSLMALEMTASQMLAPQTLGQALEWARILCDAEIVPKAYRGKPADVLTCLLFGRNLGLDVVQSLQNVAVVNGKATVYGDALLGIVLSKMTEKERDTFLETFEETWDPDVDGGKATCTARRGARVRSLSFSMADAAKIETTENDWEGVPQGGRPRKKVVKLAEKETYKNYPRRMCKFKTRNEVLRDLFPDYLLGILPREDAEDYVEAVGYQVQNADGTTARVEGLEDLIGELEPEAASQVVAGFDRLALSRAQRLVKLREHRGDAGALLTWLRDEFALQKTRGAQHYRPKADDAARRETTAQRLEGSLEGGQGYTRAAFEADGSGGQGLTRLDASTTESQGQASTAATPAAPDTKPAARGVLF